MTQDPDDEQKGSPEDELPRMSFLEHLEDLRKRLFVSALAIAVGFLMCWWKAKEIFQWLEKNNVAYDNMGEDLGNGPLDPVYGFVSTSKVQPDTKSACYMAGRARVSCDLKPFTYARLYSAFAGQVINSGAKNAVEKSADRYLRAIRA